VTGAFAGIKIAVGILIIDSAIRLFSKLEKKVLTYAVTAVSFAAMLLLDIFAVRISSVVLLLVAAAAGYIVYRVKPNKGGETE
jgi:chromate transporter